MERKKEKCKAYCFDGSKCKQKAMLFGYCTTHFKTNRLKKMNHHNHHILLPSQQWMVIGRNTLLATAVLYVVKKSENIHLNTLIL
jgi:hypothetical protein